MKTILDLSHEEAKKFFFKTESYVNIDLPNYFNFNKILEETSKILNNGSKLSDFYKDKPFKYENLNYSIYSNKDGRYSWRLLQIINPAIYVEMVNVITEEENWSFIKKKFKEFRSLQNIKCESIPVVALPKKKDKAEQILFWWEKIEQESIKQALKFNFVIHADISNCYDSIYTHTISWALHKKEIAKSKRGRNELLGNKIDGLLQDMNYGQTNGIPQGSVLSDFIAEILLGYIDLKLHKKLERENVRNYEIFRYRDDYKIFTKELGVAEKILKILSETLIEFNFKLNDKKTCVENDLILSSVKEDKIDWIDRNLEFSTIQKELLILYKFSQKYPNSGSLVRWLNMVYEKISKNEKKLIYENKEVLIVILAEIMFKNPRVIPVCIAIISIIISSLDSNKVSMIVDDIVKKFSVISNIGLLKLWLQRLIYPVKREYEFNDKLCKKVRGESCLIWNFDWLNDGKLKKILMEIDFIDRNELDKMSKIISQNEFDIFEY